MQNKEAKSSPRSEEKFHKVKLDFASQNKEDYYEQRRERKADDRQDG